MSRRRSIASLMAAVLTAAACGSTTSLTSSVPSSPTATAAAEPSLAASALPEIPSASPGPGSTLGPDAWRDPANFVAVIDNPWLPFKPGSVWRYTGTKDGRQTISVMRAHDGREYTAVLSSPDLQTANEDELKKIVDNLIDDGR